MKSLVIKVAKNKNGITLMALVVTIIILLILAGISIGMLSGDNSIINQAGNAKTQTDIAQEKEILEHATVVCMGKNKYGNIEETDLKKELENVAEVTTSGSKFKVTFPSERQYLIDQDGNVKEKNPNALEVSELYENASTYFGWDVINYAETLPEELQDTEWQLFYAGTLDGETEERIYLISKGYVKNTVLPAKNGVTPIATNGSNYKNSLGLTATSGIMANYSGSANITLPSLQKLNKKLFNYLNGGTNTNNSMKAVAYMMDSDIWSSFSASTNGYADYAIGGPTIELLFEAYNIYKNIEEGETYETQVINNRGYQLSKDGGVTFSYAYNNMIEDDQVTENNVINNPYSVSSLDDGTNQAYWISSPGDNGYSTVITVSSNGSVFPYNITADITGFRPLVLLNSNYTLEKTKDTNGNDAFKIVEQ